MRLGEFRSRTERYQFESWFAPHCLTQYSGREASEKIYDYAEALSRPDKYEPDHVQTAILLLTRFRSVMADRQG